MTYIGYSLQKREGSRHCLSYIEAQIIPRERRAVEALWSVQQCNRPGGVLFASCPERSAWPEPEPTSSGPWQPREPMLPNDTTTFAGASTRHPSLRAFAQAGASSIYDDVIYEGQGIEMER